MTDDAWNDAKARMRDVLVGIACSQASITYGEVADIVFHGHFSARSGALMQMLGEVDRAEHASKDLILASIVVRKDNGMPGKGYFAFLQENFYPKLDVNDADECRAAWEREVKRVWDAYGAK
jgi:hypothetical protein